MPNPQLENGYTRIANEILDALCKFNLILGQRQVFDFILRKTYGYGKKEDRISLSQISIGTGLSKRSVIYNLQNLEARQVIVIKKHQGRGRNKETNTLSIQKNYKKWVVQIISPQYRKLLDNNKLRYSNRLKGVVQRNRGSAKNVKKVVQRIGKNVKFFAHTKESLKKETKEIVLVQFDAFYKLYPRHEARKPALKAWCDRFKKPDPPPVKVIMDALEERIKQPDWQEAMADKNKRNFIPLPASWFNAERWQDELKIETVKTKSIYQGD